MPVTNRLKVFTFLFISVNLVVNSAFAQIVWDGESCTETFGDSSAWQNETEWEVSKPWMISIDSAFTFNGGCSWRFESRTGDRGYWDGSNGPWRSQIAQGDPPNSSTPSVRQYMEGDEFYYGFAVYFDINYPNGRQWNQFAQWKTCAPSGWPELELVANDNGGAQFVVLNNKQSIGEGGILLHSWTLHPFSKGVWHKYVVHIRHHHTDGFVEVWHGINDGPMTLVLPKQTNLDTHNEWNYPGHMGTGIYRAGVSSSPAIMWGDAYRAGKTYNAVVPMKQNSHLN